MRFKGLNLNLLVALDALLATRSVSEAGKQLALTQSATSAALAQLRTHFGDPLLIRLGNQLVPTELAEQLILPVKSALQAIENAMNVGGTFTPSRLQRRFALCASDYIAQVIMPRLVVRLSEEAPGVVLDLLPPEMARGNLLERGEVDLLLTPDRYILADHPAELLLDDELVVVGWAENPALATPLTVELFSSLGHVGVRFGRERVLSFAEREMNRLAIDRRMEVITPSFALLPRLTIGTGRIAVVPKRLAFASATELPVTIRPLPFELPPLRQMMQHHRSRSGDKGLQWLRQIIHGSVA